MLREFKLQRFARNYFEETSQNRTKFQLVKNFPSLLVSQMMKEPKLTANHNESEQR